MRALALVLVLGSATAHAEKSRTLASALSGIGVGVSSAVVVSSFFIGNGHDDINTPLFLAGLGTSIVTPSLGQIYAGEYLTLGMAVRGGAGVLAGLAFLTQRETVACDDGIHKDCHNFKSGGLALLGLAAIGYIGGMAYDVQDAPDAADRANHTITLALVPTALPHGGGLALAGTF